jgi:hypothetical protein
MKRIAFLLLCVGMLSACKLGGGDGGNTNNEGTFGSTGSGGGSTTTGSTAAGLTKNPLSGICVTGAGEIFASSNGAIQLRSIDDGATFQALDGTPHDFNAVTCNVNGTSAEDAWFVGAGGKVFRYDGSTFAEDTTPVSAALNAVHANDTSDVYAVGNGGTIIRFGGTSWADLTGSSGTIQNLYGVSGKTNNVLVVGANKTILFSASSGGAWTPELNIPATVADDQRFNAVSMVNTLGEAFVVGNGAKILHRTGLNSWEDQSSKITPITSQNLKAVYAPSSTFAVAAGDQGMMLVYDGSTWTQVTNPAQTAFSITGLLVPTTVNGLAVGTDGTDGILLKLGTGGWAKLL